ncbi:unnamed protein product [Sympodiomycopsis kandeliae]
MASILLRLETLYTSSFSRRPWLTVGVAGATVAVASDGLVRVVEKQRGMSPQISDTLRPRHTGPLVVYSFAIAPVMVKFNQWMENAFPLRAGPAGKFNFYSLRHRVLNDAAIAAPFRTLCCVGIVAAWHHRLLANMYREKGLEGMAKDAEKRYASPVYSGLGVWLGLQFVNFGLVPLRYRVIFTPLCNLACIGSASILTAAQNASGLNSQVKETATQA